MYCKRINRGNIVNKTRAYKPVNDIEISNSLLKDTLVYILNTRFEYIINTGSHYNFIIKNILETIRLSAFSMRLFMTLYICLLDEFFSSEPIKIEFNIENIYYEDVFYVLPKKCDDIVILGRTWISNKPTKPRDYKSFNLRLVLD
ncbi:hypothetical protein NGRA_3234 [Nosema granulosis]|uniref:Pol polyprotein n=1 Tax=Nosema granulosis TaxID=83296 RepID=A0A9P6KXP7_9MICR|nr:hypothetical protein NGRA_3234 [Nosema granulosis]